MCYHRHRTLFYPSLVVKDLRELSTWPFHRCVSAQVIIVELLGIVFFTAPLLWGMWLFSLGAGAVALLVGILLRACPVRDSMTSTQNPHLTFKPLCFVLV